MSKEDLTPFLLAVYWVLSYLRVMKKLLSHIFAVVAVLMLSAEGTLASDKDAKYLINPVIVELFTSQGCSSCPPADAFLKQLDQQERVLGLSFHVDYWDYIGWKDPFASNLHTKRQKLYADALRARYVYTPQVVVDGRLDAMGADKTDINRCINHADKQMKLKLSRGQNGEILFPQDHNGRNSSVWLVHFDREHTTKVLRGENRGRTLTNANVVRSIQHLGQWNGQAMALKAPEFLADGFAVIVQSARNFGHGPVRASYAEFKF